MLTHPKNFAAGYRSKKHCGSDPAVAAGGHIRANRLHHCHAVEWDQVGTGRFGPDLTHLMCRDISFRCGQEHARKPARLIKAPWPIQTWSADARYEA